jgi:hypothetical protein
VLYTFMHDIFFQQFNNNESLLGLVPAVGVSCISLPILILNASLSSTVPELRFFMIFLRPSKDRPINEEMAAV